MAKYLFVINPVAGGSFDSTMMDEVKEMCHLKNDEFSTYETTGKKDKERIQKKIEDFRPDVCVICGGDGTINLVTPLLLDRHIKLGIVPTGSANGLATELGISLDNALDKLFNGKEMSIDVIQLNDRFMLHLADIGLNARLVKRYKEEDRRGFIGYTISALQELPAIEQLYHMVVHLNGEVHHFDSKLLVIANARTYGTGFEVNPSGQLNDQKVELCILKEPAPRMLLSNLFKNEENRKANPSFEVLSASKATITTDQPIDFQFDGEYVGKVRELIIQVLPEQLTVLI